MTQLDEHLEAALQRRAETAAGLALSPAKVHAAVRRQCARTRRLTAAALVLVALPAAGFALGQQADEPRQTTQPTRPPSGTVASLPWSGSIEVSLRKSPPGGSVRGWSMCFGESCTPVAAPGAHSLSLIDQATTVEGLAPLGTARVTVAVGDAAPVDAALSTPASADSPGVLFAAPNVVVSRPEGSAFSLGYRVTAFDPEGAQLAVRGVVGGWDLANQHPVAGRPLAIMDDGVSKPVLVAWADAAGWTCWGQRAGSGADATYGAFGCTPPGDAQALALVTNDVWDGFVLVRVPRPVVAVDVSDAAGHTVVTATVHAVGSSRVAVLDRRAAGSNPGWTIRGRDASGRGVVQVPTGSLQPPDGSVLSN